MPLPTRKKDERRDMFLNRCMADKTMLKEYPDRKQRFAVCNSQADKNKR